jgi:hypothetical protein
MAFTQNYIQVCNLSTGQVQDSGVLTTGDTILAAAPSTVVPANGDGPNAIVAAFPATGFQSMILLATVPCVVTLTGVTVIDGASVSTVTLVAGVIHRIAAITGACTAISVGANTTTSGAAGTLQFEVLYNA